MTPAQVAHIMPPLPKPLTLSRGDEDGAIQLGYTADQMQAYSRAAVEAALRDAPQQAAPIAEARKADDVDRLLHQVFLLCEAVEDAPAIAPKNEHQHGFDRGCRFEAKQIRRAIGDWFQWTFCGRSFMGEPVISAAPTEAKPAQQDAVDASIPLDKEELAQLIAEHLGGTYHCNRVWEAWNVGTMSQDDFEPVDESETPTKIAEAIIDAIRAAISAKKGQP